MREAIKCGGLVGVGAAAALRGVITFPREGGCASRIGRVRGYAEDWTSGFLSNSVAVPGCPVRCGGADAATGHTGFTDAPARVRAGCETIVLRDAGTEERCTRAALTASATGATLSTIVARSAAGSAILPVTRRVTASRAGASGTTARSAASRLRRATSPRTACSARSAWTSGATTGRGSGVAARHVSSASTVVASKSRATRGARTTRCTRAARAAEIHAPVTRALKASVAMRVVAGATFGSRWAVLPVSTVAVAVVAAADAERDGRNQHARNASKQSHGRVGGSSHAHRPSTSCRLVRPTSEEAHAWLT
jgi:hypothetical protein